MRDCKGIKISLGMSLQRGLLTLTRGLLGSETGPRELSAEFVFHCPGFQHDGPSPALDFLRILPLPRELHRVGLLMCLASSVRGLFQPG